VVAEEVLRRWLTPAEFSLAMEVDELRWQRRTLSPTQRARLDELERVQPWLLLLVLSRSAAAQGYAPDNQERP